MAAAAEWIRIASELASLHEDTRRFHRALAQAGNATGAVVLPVPSVHPSKLSVRFHELLRKQVRTWQRIVNLNRKEGREDKWSRMAERRLASAQRNFSAYGPTAIVFNAFGRGKEDRLITVRAPVYGGTGDVTLINGKAYVRLHNKEPHASIVEWRYQVMRNALRIARAKGAFLRAYRRNYLPTLLKGAR